MRTWLNRLARASRRPRSASPLEALVHIGTEKTGSTALQSWLAQNAEQLAAQGVHVVRAFGSPAATGAAVFGAGLKAGADLLQAEGIASMADLEDFRRRSAEAFAHEAQMARSLGRRVLVISCEHLHSRLVETEQVRTFSCALAPSVDRLRVLAFLRPQADLARSVQSNHALWGIRISSETFLATARGAYADGPYFDYAALLDRWQAGGVGSIDFVPYRRIASPIDWLMEDLSLDRAALQDPSAFREKGRIDLEVAAALNELSTHLPEGPEFLWLRELVAQIGGSGTPLTFSRRDAEGISAMFAASNAALCRRMTSIQPEDLQPDPEDYPEIGSIEAAESSRAAPLLARALATIARDCGADGGA